MPTAASGGNAQKEIKMIGNFSYSNPTKLYFGENALDYLNKLLLKGKD